MKTIQFTLFGREILLRYVFHITRKPKPLQFSSLKFKEVKGDAGNYTEAEMRIGGAYLIKVRPVYTGYCIEINQSGRMIQYFGCLSKKATTALMRKLQNGEYKGPSDEDTHRKEGRRPSEETEE